ncbi:CopG family transcriptional regulator [Pukyongiella litopenaei]|uniref:Ribbon-helix-helix protein, CopG family n=1 Tax=Pukyongiella litopenaei TaxID=2605946 RepID=A0A5C2H7D8_9RHOB|nr:CopG family transcriptional regulator [Pukyongiella litopenaei]QEP30633.1 ribbon-helix-helix protein, CopG family [Pukyongiella litopenaei]
MSVMTIRLPDAQHERLRQLAKTRGVSINKVIEELTTRALTEFDLETRFHTRAARGDPDAALHLLDRMDQQDASEENRT